MRAALGGRGRRSTTAVLLAVLATPLAAQSGVKGRVIMDPTNGPLAGVEVLIEAIWRSVTTDSAGEFYLAEIPAGEHQVLARRIGFQPRRQKVRVVAGETALIEFRLTPTVAVLESLVVIGKAPVPASPRLADFERRRAVGPGRFLTWAHLRIRHNWRTSEVLREIGVITRRDRMGGEVVVSGRRSTACPAQVFLDGILVSQGAGVLIDVNNYIVETLAGVEYYAGPAETPPEFNVPGTTCGTLVLWTRDR